MLRALFLAAIVALSCPTLAVAQDPSALIAEGVALREQGRDEEALERFVRAHDLAPSGRTFAQIALAEQALGRFVHAEDHLVRALTHAGEPFIERNRHLLEQALEEIRAGIGELVVVTDAEDAVVTIEGTERATFPAGSPIRLSRGEVRLEVEARGYLPFRTTVEIVAGERVEETVALIEDRCEYPPEEPEPSTDAEWMLPTGLALAGAGMVGIGLGVGLAIVREDHARARLTCSDLDPACRDRYHAALDAEGGAIAGFVVGGALTAAGAVFLGLTLVQSSASSDVALACAPGMLGLQCAGAF